jgi:hypothetical protein
VTLTLFREQPRLIKQGKAQLLKKNHEAVLRFCDVGLQARFCFFIPIILK